MPSRSRSTNRGAVSKGDASMICRAVHRAVGLVETSTCTIRRRSWRNARKQKKMRTVTVGTVKKSTAAICPA
jgi:hypothetical protein